MHLPFAPVYEGESAPPEVVEKRLAALPVDDGGLAESEETPDPIHAEIMKELRGQQEQYDET